MPNRLKKLINNKEAAILFAALSNEVRFVGGCVRDFILGRKTNDIDVATPHLPDEVMKLLKDKGIKVIPTGIKHGTVTAIINNVNFEITTLRRDVACDGRHAEVEFTNDWEEDAARRDFTVNAMSCSIDGKIYDYFDGRVDLEQNIVRFVGNAKDRCTEDALRILRFFRFNAYYGKNNIDKDGLAACAELAANIDNLSGERVREEMLKLLRADNPVHVLQAMERGGVLDHLFGFQPHISRLETFIGIESEMQIVNNPLLRLALIMQDDGLSKDALKGFSKRWRLSTREMKYLSNVVFSEHTPDINEGLQQNNMSIRNLGKKISTDILLIEWATNASLGDKYKKLITYIDKWDIPVFLVAGKDLKEIGFVQGKEIGEALKKAEHWWEENDYKAVKKDVVEYIKQLYPQDLT